MDWPSGLLKEIRPTVWGAWGWGPGSNPLQWIIFRCWPINEPWPATFPTGQLVGSRSSTVQFGLWPDVLSVVWLNQTYVCSWSNRSGPFLKQWSLWLWWEFNLCGVLMFFLSFSRSGASKMDCIPWVGTDDQRIYETGRGYPPQSIWFKVVFPLCWFWIFLHP